MALVVALMLVLGSGTCHAARRLTDATVPAAASAAAIPAVPKPTVPAVPTVPQIPAVLLPLLLGRGVASVGVSGPEWAKALACAE